MNRRETLEAALACVMTDRNRDYDEPERNFERIAALWNGYFGQKLGPEFFEPHDVAVLLALVKVARIATSPGKQDHWTDLAGYAACGAEVATKEAP